MAKLKGQGHGLAAEVSAAYVSIVHRIEIQGPSAEMGEVNVTDLDSTAEETLPTLLNPGELTLKVWYDPNNATHQQLTTDLQAGTVRNYRITHTDSLTTKAKAVFAAFVKSFQPTGMKSGDYLSADVTLKITGPITFTPGS
jgi:hypothetical protein